ncbi:MAG: pseudouridine-5'-phosphate glycosidase [Anaerolineae bacterium]|nr:pseudouridine-5'-phosphate glycosidase [Anaerolineae bacterium]
MKGQAKIANLEYSREIIYALENHQPVVALETAVLTHGLPYPQNIQLAKELEAEVRDQGAIPATIGVLDGKIVIGLSQNQIERLGSPDAKVEKLSRRDLSGAVALKQSGGTTVAATVFAAHAAHIQVFATGGIGGVHRNAPFDISADLLELSRNPVIVVCSGAKAILDLPATLELLETMSVPVIGYETGEFPAFYTSQSGLAVKTKCNSPAEVAVVAKAHWEFGMNSALLVVAPPPTEYQIPLEKINLWIKQANNEAKNSAIRGSQVTPFLLRRVNELSGGKSLETNLALLKNNTRIAARISRELMTRPRQFSI